MKQLQGIGVSNGIAMGKICLVQKKSYGARKERISDVAKELQRFEDAVASADADLSTQIKTFSKQAGAKNALVFEAHRMMLQDEDFVCAAKDMIRRELVCAEYAVSFAGKRISRILAHLDDPYMRERVADVADVTRRVLAILMGNPACLPMKETVAIYAGVDFSPSETAALASGHAQAVVTKEGTAMSHTAIFARAMSIPAVVGIADDFEQIHDSCYAIVDGAQGTVILDPTAEVIDRYCVRNISSRDEGARLQALKGLPNETKSGKRIDICVNIHCEKDIDAVIINDSDGIGLFRSEFLYLGATSPPTEEEQYEVYRAVLAKMKGKRVNIRTLDLGADKNVPYLGLPAEENPALGYRGLRICLDNPELFLPQLCALLRASVAGNLAIVLPFVTSMDELLQAKKYLADAKADLKRRGLAYADSVPLGIMIETPAAALISDELAKEADFFSIGTNDLAQYTLACDRMNPKLSRYLDTRHEALFKLMEMAASNIHKEGKKVSICGELAADEECLSRFLSLGIDGLSVAPRMVLRLREKVRALP